MQRKWVQRHPTLSLGKHRAASWIHFDIAKGKRSLVIQTGAIETDRYGPSYLEAQRRGVTNRIKTIEELLRRRGWPADGIVSPAAPTTDGGAR